ncbi:uncharacterized protein EI97DRAFT_425202 [Westerdykella ornata]|uniref:EamA domain-containing protein n=1 Tax=Westerdykella ornata TaxID=318751 RepID=A0A6A6J9T4_WESOR|nr:uncharacterized protein EI97DRAFT_425202 [Westerdykella ornata]KAF2273017.1 hypothetical protein EI97DRAFT_425202 [Westerdykella ornata]
MSTSRPRSAWLLLAIASGACAAFNGVFAKLTTTELTTSWAHSISKALSINPSNKPVEFVIRAVFFALNLLFNAVMWGLFTRALTLASSTVRVSVINTSANFMITAILGAVIFSEQLPGLWWIGAGLLVAGSVIIGRREEGAKEEGERAGGTEPLVGDGGGFKDEEVEEDDLGEGSEVELRSVQGRGEGGSSEDEDGVLK